MKKAFLSVLRCLFMVGIANIMIPRGKCEKQIKFLCGIMFINSILGIFIDPASADALLASPIIPGNIHSAEYEDISKDISGYIFDEYAASLNSHMREKIASDTGVDAGVYIEVISDEDKEDYGDISSVTVSVSSEEEFLKAKKLINSFYGVGEEHIYMHIKEE